MSRCVRFSASALLAALWFASTRLAHAQDGELPPPGFGTLRQDEVGVRLQTASLQIRVLPLDERVIRLLAPDAWRSLHEVASSRSSEIAAAARAAGHDSAVLFLVQFFAIQPETQFSPELIEIVSQSVAMRPLGIVPLTPRWSEYRLEQRQQAAAIYLFEPAVAVLRPFTVRYGDLVSDAWARVLPVLDAERSRAFARARRGSSP